MDEGWLGHRWRESQYHPRLCAHLGVGACCTDCLIVLRPQNSARCADRSTTLRPFSEVPHDTALQRGQRTQAYAEPTSQLPTKKTRTPTQPQVLTQVTLSRDWSCLPFLTPAGPVPTDSHLQAACVQHNCALARRHAGPQPPSTAVWSPSQPAGPQPK
jgi:hypothetical protein